MGSGKHLSTEDKYRIYVHSTVRGKTARWIFDNLFLGDDSNCTLAYIEHRMLFFARHLRLGRFDEIIHYIVGSRSKRGGRKRRMSAADDLLIERIIDVM